MILLLIKRSTHSLLYILLLLIMSNIGQTPTLNSVQRNLLKGKAAKQSIGQGYLACRYGENRNNKAVEVPDGVGSRLLLSDYDSTYVITTTGLATIDILPTFPTQGVIHARQGVTVNGDTFAAGVPGPLITPRLNNFTALPGSLSLVDLGRSARIITVTWSLVYTGKSSDCQGTIFSDVLGFNIDIDPERNAIAATYANAMSGVVTTVAVNTIYMSVADVTRVTAPIVPSKLTVSGRPEMGWHGVLKRMVSSRAHPFKPLYQQPVGLFYDDTAFTAPVSVINASTTYPNCWAVRMVDGDFNGERLTLNMPADYVGSWILRINTCVEMQKTEAFAYIDLTHEAALSDPAILDLDDRLAAMALHSAPLSTPLLPIPMVSNRGPQRRRKRTNAARPKKPAAPRRKPKGGGGRRRKQKGGGAR